MNRDKPNILFLCAGNSCRSQMAEGWARYLRDSDCNAYSAGIKAQGLNSTAVMAMANSGIDISAHESKTLTGLRHIRFHCVFTVCGNAHDNCPVFPGDTQIVHRPFDDPPALAKIASNQEEAFAHYLRVCHEIRNWVADLRLDYSL